MKQRILELDFLRGLAVLGMIIFHFFFILDFLNIQQHAMYESGWLILARAVQFSFLTLVGIGITFSRNNTKRGLIVLVAALIITLATYISEPTLYVRFGILHFIAISILILKPIKKLKYTVLLLAATALLIDYFISQISSANLFFIILGFQPQGFATLDYFPIFPWISLPLIGIYLGNTIYKNRTPVISNKFFQFRHILFLGRHALVIYLLHIPLIYGVLLLWLFSNVK